MTKLTFLGSGSAFALPQNGNYQSNMILETDSGKRLLIDCGTQCFQAMHDLGYTAGDIDAVYISHIHFDHCGSCEEFAFRSRFIHNKKPILFAHPKVLGKLRLCLQEPLGVIDGREMELCDWFQIGYTTSHPGGGTFTFDGIKFTMLQHPHISVPGYATKAISSYGLIFTSEGTGKRIYITTDTNGYYQRVCENSDLIFHDCEVDKTPSRVHVHISDLQELPEHIKAKMWLYHYQDGDKPDPSGFAGYVQKGQVFEL